MIARLKPHWMDSRLSGTIIAVLYGWLFAALALIVEPEIPDLVVNPALERVEDPAKILIGIGIAIGCIFILVSNIKWKTQSTAWKLELTGLPLLIAGWLYYTVSILIIDGFTLFPIFLGIGHTAACAIRFVSLLKSINNTRINVELLPPEVKDA